MSARGDAEHTPVGGVGCVVQSVVEGACGMDVGGAIARETPSCGATAHEVAAARHDRRHWYRYRYW